LLYSIVNFAFHSKRAVDKIVQLLKKKQVSLERKHPWIFSGAIDMVSEDLEDGDTVTVTDAKGNFRARGHFQNATIAVRILTFKDEEINLAFFEKRIQNAFESRLNKNLLREDNNIFRLVHGEGDQLPGLIADYYDGAVVIQCHSVGMYHYIEQISNALQSVLGDKLISIYSKSGATLPNRTDAEDKYIFGECKVPHVAIENNVKFCIDWESGQKTGFFIDQRENRLLLGKYSQSKKVLNTFCYSGGFSLYALMNGATEVHSLDSSKKAVALTEENLEVNKLNKNHKSIVADAMEHIKELPEEYDLIILDPPAFAKHRNKRHKAIQGYKRLNAAAIKQIKTGGVIFTFSCSQVVDKQLFTNTIIAASIEAKRNVRILEQLHQPSDHPVSAFHPEGAYLKGLVIQVD
jgi:23S rRNA (cytosine1962-C5)-methyltransferase